jgi:hypothetical protein
MRACGNKSKVGRFVGGQLNHYRPRGPPTSLLASYLSYNTLHADAELDTDENKKGKKKDSNGNHDRHNKKHSSSVKSHDNSYDQSPHMYYRILGNTGLQVSVFSYGYWSHQGDKDQGAVEQAKKCLTIARDAGVNYFDNSNVYGSYGDSERILGTALKELQSEDSKKWRRADLIIGTKVTSNMRTVLLFQR